MPKTNTKGRPNPTDKHVGAQIRMRRMMFDMSQTTLGAAAGITFQQIQKYEQGINRVSASRMQQFARALDVPVSFFFDGAPEADNAGRQSGTKAAITPAYVSEFIISREGQAIIKAFSRIDRKLRQTIVALAEELAEGA